MQPALAPVLDVVAYLTRQIQAFDKLLAEVASGHYPAVQRLQQIDGIGPVISVAFVLTVEDPQRFASSRPSHGRPRGILAKPLSGRTGGCELQGAHRRFLPASQPRSTSSDGFVTT